MNERPNHWETVKNDERLKVIETYEDLYRQEKIDFVPVVSFETITCPIEQKGELQALSAQIDGFLLYTKNMNKNKFYSDLPIVDSQDGKSTRLYFVCEKGHLSDLESMLDEMKSGLINLPQRRKSL